MAILDWHCRTCDRRGTVVRIEHDSRTEEQRVRSSHIAKQPHRKASRCADPNLTWLSRPDQDAQGPRAC